MLDNTDAEIIGWTRAQILNDREAADDVPDGPWFIWDDAHAVISPADRTIIPAAFPQTIKPTPPPGLNPGAMPTIAETFDSPGLPQLMGPYLIRFADPLHARAAADSRLAMLELCHRTLAADHVDGDNEDTTRPLARQFLRLLAAAFNSRPGYQQVWAPLTGRFGGTRPVTQTDIDRVWPDAVPAGPRDT
jgi:hypothetical protein